MIARLAARLAAPLALPLAAALMLSGCETFRQPELSPLGGPLSGRPADPRVNGAIRQPSATATIVAYGSRSASGARATASGGSGEYSLDFADTDIREVVAQIMGQMLRLNYEIDPAVKGTVTLRTARPLTSAQLLPALQTMLGSVNAALVGADGLFRNVPAAAAGGAGSMVVALQYVSAEELAKVLQPMAGANTKIAAESALNAL